MKVVLVSDTHLTERAPALGENWMAVRAWLGTIAADLVVHLGDISARGAEDAGELEAARPAFDGLGREIRFVPGNHDIGDNPMEPGAPNKHPLHLRRLGDYRRLFGADWWTLRAGGWQVLGLDAQLFGSGTTEEARQFVWLEEQVRDHAGPVGLMLHKPLFRNGPDDTEAHVRYVPAAPRRRLLACLAGCDLRFVVSGHAHQARRLRVGAVEHVWAPSTAYCIPDAIQERIGEKIVGVLTLDLEDGGHRFEVVIPDGLVQHDIWNHPQVYPELAPAGGGGQRTGSVQ